MRERPILFSAPMVQAILDGRKTQTRRIVQIPSIIAADINDADTASERNGLTTIAWLDQHEGGPGFYGWLSEYPEEGSISLRCPYGVPGDRLWVRENFMPAPMEAPPESPRRTRWDIVYAAGGAEERMAPAAYNPMLYNYERWSPSIHMPRWASRITLEVVGVRVERLQDISEADAVAEGVAERAYQSNDGEWLSYNEGTFAAAYGALWDSLNAKRGHGWDANPWVWRIEFKRIAPAEREG